jgi:hypothetical protein
VGNLMSRHTILSEEQLIADLQSPRVDVRRNAARELGSLATGDEREVSALVEVLQNDWNDTVREMAYWALSSPANLAILSQHPEWQACILPLRQERRRGPKWWAAIIDKFLKP